LRGNRRKLLVCSGGFTPPSSIVLNLRWRHKAAATPFIRRLPDGGRAERTFRSCGLLLRQAMERAETQHQVNGMDTHYGTILE